jgi:hypothetical protein
LFTFSLPKTGKMPSETPNEVLLLRGFEELVFSSAEKRCELGYMFMYERPHLFVGIFELQQPL